MRKKLIAGNWKMNMTISETQEFFSNLKNFELSKEVDKLICTPYTSLETAVKKGDELDIKIGAQNMNNHESGAYTGEISAQMLKEIGVEYVILGHSERREIFKECDELINEKTKFALEKSLTPLLCIGETLCERESNKHFEKVKTQIKKGFDGISADDAAKIIIAYEPIWAIGTGKTATAEDASEMCGYIRKEIENLYGTKVSNNIRILYGGSVKPQNVTELMNAEDIDGALVGGASLKAEDYSKLVNY